jgi:hypothetical protein
MSIVEAIRLSAEIGNRLASIKQEAGDEEDADLDRITALADEAGKRNVKLQKLLSELGK